MNKTIVIIFIAAFYLAGCSGLKNKKTTPLKESLEKIPTAATIDTAEDNSVASVSKQLSKLVEEAREKGPEAMKYVASDLYFKAADSSMLGDSQTAAFLFEHIHSLYPEDFYLKRKYAIELIRSGQLKKSLPLVLSIYEKSKKKDENIGLILGGLYSALEDTDKSRSLYREVIKHHKKSEEGCIFLAKSYSKDNDLVTADKVLRGCEKANSKAAVFTFYRGKMAIEADKVRKGEAFFKKTLRKDPKYYQAAVALGLIYEENEKYKKAAKIYEQYLKKDPENVTVLSRMVNVLFALGDFQKVVPYGEKLTAIDPDDLNLKVRLGILYTDAKRYKEAIGILKEVLVTAPDSDKVLYYLGSLYQQTGAYEDSLEYFNKITAESGLYMDSSLQIAQILNLMAFADHETGKSNNIAKFLDYMKNSMGKMPKIEVELASILAGYHEGQGNIPSAISEMKNVTAHEAFGENHYYYLASLYEKNQNIEESRNLILVLLEKNPENAHALNFLGYSYLEANEQLPNAYKLITKALSLKPGDGYILDSLGWYYYKTGDLEKALVQVKKAWDKVNEDVVVSKHLAIIYQELKQYKVAQKYYEEALKNCKYESEKIDIMNAMKKLRQLRVPASKEK